MSISLPYGFFLGQGQPSLETKWIHPGGNSYGYNSIELPRTPEILQKYINRCPTTLSLLQINAASIHSISGVLFPENLININLHSNYIVTLNEAQFPQRLTTLNLSNNRIHTLEGVQFPQSLTTLNLSNNRIETLEGVQFPPNLTILELGWNFIPNLDRIQFPHNMRELSLNDNNLIHMSGVQFPNGLTKLDLSNSPERGDDRGGYGYNQLKSFNDVKFPHTLTELNLLRNRIETVGKIIEPTENVLQLIERQFPKIVEQYRQNVSRQSQQTRQSTLKEISDFNQLTLQNQIRGITSFLREGMETRAQQHSDNLKEEGKPAKKPLFYVNLSTNGKQYPVPLDSSKPVHYVLDYLNEHYYISSLVPNCGAIKLYKTGIKDCLETDRLLSDYGIQRDETLNAKCIMLQLRPTNGGGRVRINKINEYKKKWSMKYKRSINCRRPRGFSQRQHCKYGRRGWNATTRRIKSSSARD